MKYFWRNVDPEKTRHSPRAKYLVSEKGLVVFFIFFHQGFYLRAKVIGGDVSGTYETEKEAMDASEMNIKYMDELHLEHVEFIDQTNQEKDK